MGGLYVTVTGLILLLPWMLVGVTVVGVVYERLARRVGTGEVS